MSLQDIRDYVRDYFDIDSEDLPDRLLDRWVSEGWGKIVRYRPNWPGFQAFAELTVDTQTSIYAMPLKDIESIEGPDRFLIPLDPAMAERRFIRGGVEDPAGVPVAFSVYGNQIRLWPSPSAVATYKVRGQRAAVNPLDNAANPEAVIDLPHPDAVEMLVAWVLSRAALRESEDEQAAKYEEHFSQGMQLLAKDELDSSVYTPIVLGSIPAPRLGLDAFLPDRLRFADGWE